MKRNFFAILLSLFLTTYCMAQQNTADVVITTDLGKISLKLFDETPAHKANFLKLAQEGFYDGIAFHRIIKNFMIQTGNPSTRNPNPSSEDGPGYMQPAEISPKYVHTRGMLAAARLGDQVNPEWKSSGSQFYIVTGNKVEESQLGQVEANVTNAMTNRQVPALQQKFMAIPENAALVQQFQTAMANKDTALATLKQNLDLKFTQYVQANMQKVEFKYTPEQRAAYKEKGGSPWLDQQYTIFGEVVEGMDVVAKLEAVETGAQDKPVKDVRIIKVEVIKK